MEDLNVHQGYAYDGENHYLIDSNKIDKYNSQWDKILTKEDYKQDQLFTAIGDGDIHDGFLYVPAAGWDLVKHDWVHDSYRDIDSIAMNGLVKVDLNTLEIVSVKTAPQKQMISAITAHKDHIYGVSFSDGTKIWKFDYDMNILQTIDLPHDLTRLQGIEKNGSTFYLTENDGKIWTLENEELDVFYTDDREYPFGQGMEGLEIKDEELVMLHDKGEVEALEYFDIPHSVDFLTPMIIVAVLLITVLGVFIKFFRRA